MPTNYMPRCLREIPKARVKPRNQAIREAKIEAFNIAISIIKERCRDEKSERVKSNMYAAVSDISRLRDEL